MTTTEELKAKNALALIVGIARAHREMHDEWARHPSEQELIDALRRIEEYGYEAMPHLRDAEKVIGA